MDIRSIGIHGGEGMEKQFSLLASRPDVIVATPGRLAHHLTEIPDFTLSGCAMCILDEADRLMEMGFAQQIRQIAKTLPENCQKVLLSATMPKTLVEFTKSGFAHDPRVVRLDNEASVSAELRIAFITCRSLDKDAALLHLLHTIRQDQEEHASQRTGLTLVFAATRHHVEYVTLLIHAAGYDATMIYGTLDHEARQINLQAFRSGKKPILVVTDVAARGIDVPLIDHVIHYHFPPSPKLFVHRSGRAARAGRIGYCWGLVEPDEMPYMIELHLFLGRRPTSGTVSDENEGEKQELIYNLEEMTPEMVHYGCVPESTLTMEVENVQRILSSEMSGSRDVEHLKSLMKVCNNAMKQYRRTRTEASREAIRRAKAIMEGERLDSGERVGGVKIPPHPLLRCMEENLRKELEKRGKVDGLGNRDNLRKREEFLQAMSQFRPKETVFEAFATGRNKEVGVVSHLDKGRTTSSKKNDSTAALAAMKNMRRQLRMARDKGTSLIVAGSEIILDNENGVNDETENTDQDNEEANTVSTVLLKVDTPVLEHKRRLSRAERKKMKKDPDALTIDTTSENPKSKDSKKNTSTDFRDPQFYMENDFTSNTEEARRARQVEAAMQPSTASSMKGTMGQALRIEEAMLDIVGDEREELVKKQRLMRWDKAKRKYVQTTVGSELSGDSKSKKMRVESGHMVKTDKMKLSELYEKWQKKTNQSIGRTGVFDDVGKSATPVAAKIEGGLIDEPVRNPLAIKKERERKENMRIKNMKKGDRRKLESKNRQTRMAAKISTLPTGKKSKLLKKKR
jgi:ATP-dependent RNA helicase DDX54/DBP10